MAGKCGSNGLLTSENRENARPRGKNGEIRLIMMMNMMMINRVTDSLKTPETRASIEQRSFHPHKSSYQHKTPK